MPLPTILAEGLALVGLLLVLVAWSIIGHAYLDPPRSFPSGVTLEVSP